VLTNQEMLARVKYL